MSDIRPFTPFNPAALPPAGATPPARQAQAAFFRAAMAQVEATQAVPAPARPASAASVSPANSEAQAADRPLRPGSYLDIRV